jgi:fatty-acyl-CoA synthase
MSLIGGLRRDAQVVQSLLPVLLGRRRAGETRAIDFSDMIEPYFQSRADRAALIGESGSLTWRELDAFANRVAHWALSEGLSRGDVVALLMENRPEFVAIWLGLSRVGVVSALLNTNLTGDRLAHCMGEADASHWIVGAELAEAAASALPELEKKPKILVAGTIDSKLTDPAAIPQAIRDVDPDALPFDRLIAARPTTAVDPAHRSGRLGRDGLFLIYTSGTTGLPKAARISHSKAITSGLLASKVQGLTVNDRSYCCLPLYHSAGGMMCAGGSLLSGGALVIARRFSAKRFWSDCAQHDVTSFQYIGELCRYMLNSPSHPDERRHRVRCVIGNGLRPEVWQPFQERFGIPRIVEFYGATEGNMALINVSGKVGAVGQLPGFLRKAIGVELVRFDIETEEIVRGPDGRCQRCDFGEAGELLIKITKSSRFEGYTNASATEKKIVRDAFEKGDAWFRSGDLLRLDDEGFYFFVDRIGDTFRWKGENVSTNEVAEVISTVPGVEEANVYGVPIIGADGRAGMAALVTNDAFDLGELARVVESDLASYARPLFVRILPEMEITGTFKQRKVDLVRDGFDPRRLSDPIHFLDPETRRYVRLDTDLFERIGCGQIRL